jgi:nickel/cobalt exporter
MPLPTFVLRLAIAVPAALVVTGLAASAALAHPLGNFTINHYAGVRVSPSDVLVDVVIDMAEIPAFGERRVVDVDGSGDVSVDEIAGARIGRCGALAGELGLDVDGRPRALELRGAGLSFPEGTGGLPTLRLACRFGAAFDAPLGRPTQVSFADRSHPARAGWREIVVVGDGVVVGGDVSRVAMSDRLRAYPDDLLAQPLDVRSVAFTVSPGGDRVPPIADVEIVPVRPAGTSPDGPPPRRPRRQRSRAGSARVPCRRCSARPSCRPGSWRWRS